MDPEATIAVDDDAAAEAAAFAEESERPDPEDDLEPAPKPAPVAAEPSPPAAPTPPAPAAAATPAPAPTDGTDPYADLPPAVRDALAEIPHLRHRAESNDGRVAGLNKALQDTRAELDRVKATQAPPAAAAPALDSAALDPIRQEGLPEMAAAIEKYVGAALKTVTPPAAPAAAPVHAAATPAPGPAAASDPELTLMNKEYPGWSAKMDSTNFQLWLGRQTPEYQREVLGTSRSGVLITALNRFDKFETDAKAAAAAATSVVKKRASRVAAAVTPEGKTRPAVVRASEAQTEEEGFEAEARSRSR